MHIQMRDAALLECSSNVSMSTMLTALSSIFCIDLAPRSAAAPLGARGGPLREFVDLKFFSRTTFHSRFRPAEAWNPPKTIPQTSPAIATSTKFPRGASRRFLALASLPTGPAAASASPPIVNLSESNFFMPLSFMISMKTSVEDPPIRTSEVTKFTR
jgi:hypothetical protein